MNEVISDISDKATELEMLASDAKIKKIQIEANKPLPKGTGECLWCGETIKDERRFCNRECCDCYEKWGRQ